MPQIPDSFVPSATTSPLGVSPMSATPVDPMRNAAPGQEQQSGADTQRLGDETNDIGERIKNQLDNAMAKQAETAFLNKVLTITSGDGTAANPGYLNRIGQDAINGLTAAQTAIAKAKADGEAGLADDFQKSMYNRVASQHLLSFGRQMADHNFQQGQQYYTEASANRANSYATLASNSSQTYGQVDANGNQTGDFLKYAQVAEQNTLDAVQRSKGAPPGSGQANEALLNLHTQIGIGTLVQMMDAPQDSRPSPAKIQSVYEDMKSKGWLTLQAQDQLGKMVKSFSDQETAPAAARQALSDAMRASQGQPTSSTGTPDYSATPIKGATVTAGPYDPGVSGSKPGGVTISVPQGSSIQAPADGKVTQAGRDAATGNFGMKIEHADGSVTSFTGLTASNVKVGDQVQGGENVATSGTADGKTPSVLWSLTDAKGTNVDPTRAGLAPVDLSKITDEKVLDSALDSMRKQITDPKLQFQTGQEMIRTVRENQQMASAAKSQTLQQATDAFYGYANQHGGNFSMSSISPSLQGQIPPEALNRFRDIATNGPLTKSDQRTQLWLIDNMNTATPKQVKTLFPLLSPGDQISWYKHATEVANDIQANGQPKTVVSAGFDKDQFDNILSRTSFGSLISPKPNTSEATQKIQLVSAIQDDIAARTRANGGKPLDYGVKAGIIRDHLVNDAVMIPHTFSSDEMTQGFAATPGQNPYVTINGNKEPLSQIPQNVHDRIQGLLENSGRRATEADIMADWISNGRPRLK